MKINAIMGERPYSKYVAYYRVNAKCQEQRALDLHAQEERIQGFISNEDLIKNFTDVESGSKRSRHELDKAIAFCKKESAVLLIAKLDRLSRDISFISKLQDSGVHFKACDLPDFNTRTIGLFTSFAQYESEKISKRTSAALQAKLKRDGKWWGVINSTDESRKKGTETIRRAAHSNENNQRAMAFIAMMLPKRWTLSKMADELNMNDYKTRGGKNFRAEQVRRLIARREEMESERS
jgi:DNA invertase Pin-like site-specific DNA recombinase